MILIKNIAVLRALLSKEYHPLLIEIVLDVISIAENVVVTEGWREGGGVHSTDPCRGLDIRSRIYTPEELQEIQNYIDLRWIYDSHRPKMKCLIIHGVGNNKHIHLQCHPNTRKIA